MSTSPTAWILAAAALWLAGGCDTHIDDIGDDDTTVGDDDSSDDDTTAGDDDSSDDDTAGDDDTTPGHPAVGRDFVRDHDNANFVQPAGLGAILQQYASDYPVVLHVEDIDPGAGTIVLYGGVAPKAGPDYVQDLCQPTWDLAWAPPGVWTDPGFSAGPTDIHYMLEGNPGTTYGFQSQGSIPPAGDQIVAETVSGAIDTRALDSLIDPGGQMGAACELLASLGIPCNPCPGGAGPFCVDVLITDLYSHEATVHGEDPGTGQPTAGLVRVTPAMVDTWEAAGHCP